jgi:hypothetical protein
MRSVMVHDVDRVTRRVRVNVNAWSVMLAGRVLNVACRLALHVSAALLIHKVSHGLPLLFLRFAFLMLFCLRFVMRRVEIVAATFRVYLALNFGVARDLRMVALAGRLKVHTVLAFERPQIWCYITGLRRAIANL